jgi:DNA-binding beta-propeller fold protein YncE
LYETGRGSDKIYEYDVSTPYDIDTATFSKSIASQGSYPTGITWNNDGSKLYEGGLASAKIYESDVSTPYDIATATFSQSINTQDSVPRAITWNNDGSKMYEIGYGSDKIYEYDVTPAQPPTVTASPIAHILQMI